MSVIGRRGRARIIVFLIAVCTLALVYLPPYERLVYSKSEVNKADIEEDSDYMAIGCKGGDDITVLDASEMSKEEVRKHEGIFVLKIDAKNLEPLGIYRPAGFSSGKAGYIENRFKVFWERMDDAYAQYYLATFADGEKMAIMINDRTFHVPSKGEIVLPISDTTIDSDLVEYTNNKVEEDWIIDAASGFVKTEQMENFNQIRIFAVAILFVVGVIVAIICLLVRNAKNKRI